MKNKEISVICSSCGEVGFAYEYEDYSCNCCDNIMECVFEVSIDNDDYEYEIEILKGIEETLDLEHYLDITSTCETVEEYESIIRLSELGLEENEYVNLNDVEFTDESLENIQNEILKKGK